MEMKKYAVIAVCENGIAMINRRGETKGYDDIEEAKSVAKEHSNIGVPVYVVLSTMFTENGGYTIEEDVAINDGKMYKEL